MLSFSQLFTLKNSPNIPGCPTAIVLLLWSHWIFYHVNLLQKPGKYIEEINAGNEQITHRFFDFENFTAQIESICINHR